MATAKKDDITRLVKIKLFKDKDKYSEDVTVVVNGTTFRIQRGVEVEVPYYVAEVLRNSEKADEETETKISELVAKMKAIVPLIRGKLRGSSDLPRFF